MPSDGNVGGGKGRRGDDSPYRTPVAKLVVELRRLHREAGAPSSRRLAISSGVSHTTISDALSGKRIPKWQNLVPIVEALGGDVASFQKLWLEPSIRDEKDQNTRGAHNADEIEQSYRSRLRHLFKVQRSPLLLSLGSHNPDDRLYVPQRFVNKDGSKEKSVSLDAMHALNKRIVVLGEAGSGKTTAIRRIAASIVDHKTMIPFVVSLRMFSAEESPARSVEEYLEHELSAMYQLTTPTGWVKSLLVGGRAVVLFDGLDEIASKASKNRTVDVINLFVSAFPKVSVVVTSRDSDATSEGFDAASFRRFRLRSFTAADVSDYVYRWSQIFDLEPRLSKDMLVGLDPDLGSNPLLLAYMCSIYTQRGGYIPRSRAAIVDQYLELTLHQWDVARGIGTDGRVYLNGLSSIALMMQFAPSPSEAIAASELYAMVEGIEGLQELARSDGLAEVLDFFSGRVGILRESGFSSSGERRYEFTHPIIRDHLAGRFLGNSIAESAVLADSLLFFIDRPGWLGIAESAIEYWERRFVDAGEVLKTMTERAPGMSEDTPRLVAQLVERHRGGSVGRAPD